MISYTPEQMARLRRDPLADVDAEHEAIVELLSAPPQDYQDISRCLQARSRLRRLDAIRATRFLCPGVIESLPTDNKYDPALAVERAETQEQITRALGSLSKRDRNTIHDRFYECKRLRDMASDCGCTVQSVHTRVQRAVKRLKVLLDFPRISPQQRSDQ